MLLLLEEGEAVAVSVAFGAINDGGQNLHLYYL